MASPLSGLPPHIQQLITQLLPPLDEDPFGGDLANLHQQVLQAQAAARAAQGPLQALRQAPMPQTSPGTDALTELLGGLSQVLAPELGGLQQARGARAGVQEDMQKRRRERLSQMEKNADELADRARQLGNKELEMKYLAKAETIKSKLQREEQATQLAGTMLEGDANRQNRITTTQMEQQGQTERTRIAQDAATERALQRIPGLTKDPNTGELVAKRGITDKDFTGLIREAQKGLMSKSGDKQQAMQEFKSVWSMVREQEAFNPAAYALRLRNAGKQPGMSWLGQLGKGKEKFTPLEVADNIVAQYQIPFKTPDDVDSLISVMRQAGYTPKAAHDAVTALWNIYSNGQ